MRRLAYASVLAVLGSTVFVGCGPSLTPVQGSVDVDGAPLQTGTVTFYPVSEEGQMASGLIEGGAYELYTDASPGAVPGKYKVTVVASAEPPADDPYATPTFLVSQTYAEQASTPLEIDVASDAAAGAYDLTVEAP